MTPLPYIYVPGVPQGSDQINNTTKPINNNFQALFDLIGINHTNFNTPDTFGTHDIVTYYNQSLDPSTGSNEIALYSKPVSGDENILELFYRYPNNGAIYQLTGSSSSGSSASGSGGYYGAPTGEPTAPGEGWWVSGTWQYLNNGVLLKAWTINNYTFSSIDDTLTFQIPQGDCNYASATVPSYTSTIFCSFVGGIYGSQALVTGTGNFAPSYYSFPANTSELIVGYHGTSGASSTYGTIPGIYLITIGI